MTPPPTPPRSARVAAGISLAAVILALITLIVLLADDAPYLFGATLCLTVGVPLAWLAATSHRGRIPLWVLSALLMIGGLSLLFIANRSIFWLGALTVEVAVMAWSGGRAMHWELRAIVARRWAPAPAAQRPVLFINPKSGGQKAERFHLVDQCRRRGIEPVVLAEGDDLAALARAAVDRGADVIGMAGGDGSQAVVASVAAEHDIGFVCVPSGTRNHFALDVGVNRRDVVGALDAFGSAREARIDMAEANDRVFLNNVSLGIYAEIVSSDGYRNAKFRTVSKMLPELLGPDSKPFDLRIESPDGEAVVGIHLVLVSNGPYQLDRLGALGSRIRLDTGELGVAVLTLESPADVPAFIALEAAGRANRFEGWREWTAATVVALSDEPVAAGVDGEALEFDPPLTFRIRPGALRVRISRRHPGVSPAARRPGIGRSTVVGLTRILRGQPSGLIDDGVAPH